MSLAGPRVSDRGGTALDGAPTLEMVAAAAGVSRSTVSRVVNHSPKVRPSVVEAVNAAIAQLNYVPNRAARSLASRQTHAIALIVPEDTTRFFGDPYFAAITQGITERLESTDYVLNLLVASSDPNRKTRRYLRSGGVDGALVVSHHASDDDLADLSGTLPVVFGGRPATAHHPRTYYVDVDNVDGARRATQHLLDRGARRIATITGPSDMPASLDRLEGWRSTMLAAGRTVDLTEGGDFTTYGAMAATRRLLEADPDLDAIFAASDLMARGAVTTLTELGRRVPHDVAVIGFDNSSAAVSGEIGLTTISQPSTLMGATMAEMLLDLLAGRHPTPAACIMPTDLVIRDSA